MRVDVTRLEHGQSAIEQDLAAVDLGLPDAESASHDSALGAAFHSPIKTICVITRGGDDLLIDATIRARALMECARCLESFSAPVDADFRVYARRAGVGQAIHPVEEELDEGGVVYYGGRYIDLREAVREAILLAVPMRPLCREDCAGLCIGCGVNLNSDVCRCGRSATRAASPHVQHSPGRLN